MRILQLIYESPRSPFGFGGAGVRAHEIYKRLKGRHDITLLCMKYPGARDGEVEGLQHVFIGTESKSLTKSVLAYTVRAANFIKKHGGEFDIIVENFLPSTPFFSKFLTKTPVILQVQGVMERHSLRKFNFLHAIPMYIVEGFYPRLYDNFIFVSEVTREKVLKKIWLCPVIPNGIDERLLRVKGEDGGYLLFLSRIDIYTKGLDLLVDAFKTINAKYPDLRLVLAGYEFDPHERLTAALPRPLKEKIRYAGFVTGEEKTRLLAGAKMFILPSRHESSPISIMEAAACGKPVVVSDIPELAFVSREGLGLSFRSGSAEGLAKAINILIDDDGRREEMGKKGREFSARFLWDEIAIHFEDVLKQTPENCAEKLRRAS